MLSKGHCVGSMTNLRLEKIIQSLQNEANNDSSDAVRTVYDEWAASYDDDLDSLGYVAPSNSVQQLTDATTDHSGLLLDVGCGTGLVGQHLSQQGFTCLHGIDLSQDMLDEAAKTRFYAQLSVADLTRPLAIDSNHYHTVVCVGVMGPRLPVSPLVPELVRVAKPDGLIQIVIRAEWYGNGTDQVIANLVRNGQVTIVADDVLPYFAARDTAGRYVILRKID